MVLLSAAARTTNLTFIKRNKFILIFKYISIESVAFYGNYMLIVNNLTILIAKLFSGTNASVGNLVAENDPENIEKVFWEFMALRFFIASISTIAILKLLDPFISLWLGPKYILEHSTLLFYPSNQAARRCIYTSLWAVSRYLGTNRAEYY